jgi:hypothetical protein
MGLALMARAAAARRPPSVPEVKGMGTTWVERGASYWLRRSAAALLSLIAAVVAGILTVALARAIVAPMPTGWALITLAGIAAIVGWSFWRGWRALVRPDPARPPGYRRSGRGRQWSGATGTGLGLLALFGNAVSGAVLVLSAPFCVGWAVAWFLSCLRRYYPGEAQARAALAAHPVR